jgi:hypothetical protein
MFVGKPDFLLDAIHNADSTAKRTGFPRHREQDFGVAATRVNGGTIDSFVGSAEWQMSG